MQAGRVRRGPVSDDEEVELVEEDTPPPSTQRHPIIPPPPRLPAEPFRLLKPRQPTPHELMDAIRGLEVALGKVWATATEVLAVQRKMARQTDGLIQTVNVRFDVFHRELALLRGITPQFDERKPPSRYRLAAIVSGKYGGAALGGAVVLRIIGRLVPGLNDLVETILGTVGL